MSARPDFEREDITMTTDIPQPAPEPDAVTVTLPRDVVEVAADRLDKAARWADDDGYASTARGHMEAWRALVDALNAEHEHEHSWERQQIITSRGDTMPPIEVCDCGTARPAPLSGPDTVVVRREDVHIAVTVLDALDPFLNPDAERWLVRLRAALGEQS